MRTTLDLDENLMAQLVKASGLKTKTDAIEVAAQEYIRAQKRRQLLGNLGHVKLKDMSSRLRELEKRAA